MSPIRILLIDDIPASIEMLEFAFTKAGYEVMVATTGEEGLRLFREQSPNLVIVDLAMPGMSGDRVITEIRKHENHATRTPIIVLTAHPQNVTNIDADKLDVDLYLVKPITASEMMAFMQRFLEP